MLTRMKTINLDTHTKSNGGSGDGTLGSQR